MLNTGPKLQGRRAAARCTFVIDCATSASLAVVALVSAAAVWAYPTTSAGNTVVSTTVVLANASAATGDAAVESDVVGTQDVARFIAAQLRFIFGRLNAISVR
jgi:hypothetical protein